MPSDDPSGQAWTTIAVIGRCATPWCDRPARVHLDLVVTGHVVCGPVCIRCERLSKLGAVLLAGHEVSSASQLR